MKTKKYGSLAWLPLVIFIAGCEAIGELSKAPGDSAGRLNILYPFHGLTPQGKQEAELERLQQENKIDRQKTIKKANQPPPLPVWSAADLAALKKAMEQKDSDNICRFGWKFNQASRSKYDAATFNELKKHSEAGLPEAQVYYGLCFLTESGTSRNEQECAKWVVKAVNQDCAPAEIFYGMLYMYGRVVVQNTEEGSKWLLKAAEQGDAEAEGLFGAFLADQQGIRQDYVEAYKWLNLAVAQGQIKAIAVRDELLKQMTPEQIAEGQRRALLFRPRTRGAS